ncbi:hypothetical protein GCM10009609_70330 [Pseudonocardia aurantiaca]|uniref:Uncharacterized protein n=1 Tax=Pseudonocardia aurantiaca TaxID=75290 RepID=A0ABW4FRQ8_9PSEU
MRLLFEATARVRAGAGEVRALIDGEWVLDALRPGGARSLGFGGGVRGFQNRMNLRMIAPFGTAR